MRARLWFALLCTGLLAVVAGLLVAPLVYRTGRAPAPAPSRPPVSAHRRAAPPAVAQEPLATNTVAIIIDDCGQSIVTERAMLALPIPLTLSVLPEAPYTRTIAREALAAHKGLMLHLPMEALSHIDAGPGKITVAMHDDQIAAQVREDLRDVALAKGMNNHEGSRATADWRVMQAVMGVAAAEHRFFIDSRTTTRTVVVPTARAAGVLNASRNVFLDNEADTAYVEDMLRRAAFVAKRDGTAIAIGHPRPATLQALREMVGPLQAAGVHFTLAARLLHR